MRWLLQYYPGDGFAQLALYIFVQASMAVLLALVLSRLLRNRGAALRHAIWLCALLVILLSPVFAWMGYRTNMSLVEISLPRTEKPVYENVPAEIPADTVAAGQETTQAASAGFKEIEAEELAQVGTPALSQGEIIRAVLAAFFIVWAAGAVFFCVRLIYGLGIHAALRRSVQPLEMEGIENILDRVRRALGVSELAPVVTSATLNSPVSIGVRNPLVILPQSLAYALTPHELRDVLVHEYAHIFHRDHLVNFLQRLAGILLWWHPLLRVLNRGMAVSREEVCDNYVLRDSRATAYSRTLLELAEKTTMFHRAPVSVGLAHPRWKLEDRVAGILDKRRKLITGISSLVFCTVAAAFLVTVSAVAACRIVSADSLAPMQKKEERVDSAGMEKIENEIELCLAVPEEAEFDKQIDKSLEAIREVKDAAYYLVESLGVSPIKERDSILTRLLRSSVTLVTDLGDIDTIIFDEPGGRKKTVKVTTDKTGKTVLIDAEKAQFLFLGENPPPGRMLTAIALDGTLEPGLRLTALKAIGERGETKAVKGLVILLNSSKGAVQLRTSRTLQILTGRRFGPFKNSTLEQTEKAINRWNGWWEKNKNNEKYNF